MTPRESYESAEAQQRVLRRGASHVCEFGDETLQVQGFCTVLPKEASDFGWPAGTNPDLGCMMTLWLATGASP